MHKRCVRTSNLGKKIATNDKIAEKTWEFSVTKYAPNKLLADGTKGRLSEECRHELMAIDLVNPALEGTFTNVKRSFFFVKTSFPLQICAC